MLSRCSVPAPLGKYQIASGEQAFGSANGWSLQGRGDTDKRLLSTAMHAVISIPHSAEKVVVKGVSSCNPEPISEHTHNPGLDPDPLSLGPGISQPLSPVKPDSPPPPDPPPWMVSHDGTPKEVDGMRPIRKSLGLSSHKRGMIDINGDVQFDSQDKVSSSWR